MYCRLYLTWSFPLHSTLLTSLQDPTGTSNALKLKSLVFQDTPILDSECSQILRVANVQHIIFDIICDNLWKPFFSVREWDCRGGRQIFEDIYSSLTAEGDRVQRYWKVSTLKAIAQLDAKVNHSPLVDILVDKAIDMLRPLLDTRHIPQCKDELRKLFAKCIEVGKNAEQDRNPVQICRTPSSTDVEGWKEFFNGLYQDNTDPNQPTTPVESQIPRYVTPKVYRPATGSVICPGSALFPNTGIFRQGMVELMEIRQKTRDLGSSIAKLRKASVGSAAFAPPNWNGSMSSINVH